jgi:malate permease and related proteins
MLVWIPLLLLLGWLLARWNRLPARAAAVVNGLVIRVSLPAVILLWLPGLDLGGAWQAPVLLPWLLLPLSATAVLVLARRNGFDRGTTGALLLLVPLGNTSFLGLPLIGALRGEVALGWALLYDQLGSFPAVALYGSIVAATYSGARRPGPADLGGRLLRFPPFIALLAALVLRALGLELPGLLLPPLRAAAASLTPLAMLAVGLAMPRRLPLERLRPLLQGLALKMLAMPATAVLLCGLLGWRGEAARVAVLEAAMPPMVTAGLLAAAAGLAPDLAAGLLLAGVLLAFATVPLWSLLVDTLPWLTGL